MNEFKKRGIDMLSQEIVKLVETRFKVTDVTEKSYESLKYPKLLPMMRFSLKKYIVEGFGSLFTMDTTAMGGMMTLSTVVLTPNSGKNVPFLLIDTMDMKKKSLSYVEFYDKTEKGALCNTLDPLAEEYKDIPDYAEKEGWYIAERTPYSLIKGGEGVDKETLSKMTLDAAKRYIDEAAAAETKEENLNTLRTFQNDMCEKGNPSTTTLEKLFGKEGAKEFFKTVIMPV